MATQTLKIEDKTKIKKVILKFPHLANENSEELIKEEYYSLLECENKLSKSRNEVRLLEEELDAKKALWQAKKDLFEIEFESNTKEYTTQTLNVSIKGDSVRII